MAYSSSSPDTYFAVCFAACGVLLLTALLLGRRKPRLRWLFVTIACVALVLPALNYQTLAIDETEVTITHGVGPIARTTRIPFAGWVSLSREVRYDSRGDRDRVWRAAYEDGTAIEFDTHLLSDETLDRLRARGLHIER